MATHWRYRELALGLKLAGAWIWRFETHEETRDALFPIFADGCCDVVWHGAQGGAQGQVWRTYSLPPTITGLVLPIGPNTRMAGLRLLPGQVHSLFGRSTASIPPQGLVLDDPKWASPETAHLAMAANLNLSQLDLALQSLMAGDGPATTCERFNISARTLRRKVQSMTGCSPKQLQRMWRLRRALFLAGQVECPDWSDTEHQCGYADQAHLNRDSRALMDCTPTDLHHLLKQGQVAVSSNT
ncbi:MAG: helix-turn-helix domain-containing protein [Magnetovibrio sp.]|nr:helix-turn-helix domain-containing protein [Magnetovibrio sp.]